VTLSPRRCASLRAGEFLHLQIAAAGTVQEWAGHVQMRSRNDPRLDRSLEPHVRIRVRAADRAHGGDTVRKIKAWRRVGHLQEQTGTVVVAVRRQVWPHQREQMVMHADDTRHDRVTTQVENGRLRMRRLIHAGTDRGYLAALQIDVLVGAGRGARPVDDRDVFEDHAPRVDAHVLAHVRSQRAGNLGVRNNAA
jgi:hypothetical protein